MNKERELLERLVLASMGCLSLHSVDLSDIYDLLIEAQELLAQPDVNTQYLLDQVSRLTSENAMLKEKWLSQPEPFMFKDRKLTGSLIAHDDMYKKGYAQAELDLRSIFGNWF